MPSSRFRGCFGLDGPSGQLNQPKPSGDGLNIDSTHAVPPSMTRGPSGTNGDLGANVASAQRIMKNNIADIEIVWIRDEGFINEWISQAKGLRPGYTRSVEIEYTLDNTCGSWSRYPSDTSLKPFGVMVAGTVREDHKHLYGKIIVDVSKHVVNTSPASLSLFRRVPTGSPLNTPEVIRRKLFQTVIHELFHVVQSWLFGGIEQFDQRTLDYSRKHRDLSGTELYVNNPYEQAAERIATDLPHALLQRVASGEFDDIRRF